MKLSHHIRNYMLNRKADALLRRARRPHKQSEHMIGRSKFATGPEALVSAAVGIALLAALTLVATEPVAPELAAPAQLVSQK